MQTLKKPLFQLGQVVATPGAIDALREAKVSASDYLDRHHRGDWGDVPAEDKALNDESIGNGSRIFSAYVLSGTGCKIWIITESDRSCTTILLPDEY